MRSQIFRFFLAASGGALVNVLLISLFLLPGGHGEKLQSVLPSLIYSGALLGLSILAIDVLFVRLARNVDCSDNGWMLIAGAIVGAVFGLFQDGFSFPGIVAGVICGMAIGLVVLGTTLLAKSVEDSNISKEPLNFIHKILKRDRQKGDDHK